MRLIHALAHASPCMSAGPRAMTVAVHCKRGNQATEGCCVCRYDTATPLVDPVLVPELSITIPGGYSAKGLQTMQVRMPHQRRLLCPPAERCPLNTSRCTKLCMAGPQACCHRAPRPHVHKTLQNPDCHNPGCDVVRGYQVSMHM